MTSDAVAAASVPASLHTILRVDPAPLVGPEALLRDAAIPTLCSMRDPAASVRRGLGSGPDAHGARRPLHEMTLRHSLLTAGNRALGAVGLSIARSARTPDVRHASQQADAQAIVDRHDQQTIADVERLNRHYQSPVLGEVDTWELLGMLGQCVDPTDQRLGAASQLVHVLQVLDAMVADGNVDEDLLLVALFHDLGKVLLLTDEDPANVVCLNHRISGEVGAGLEHLTTTWNHDEFAYLRLDGILPEEHRRLVRFHSVLPADLEPYLAPADQDFARRLHAPFARYDHESKSAFLRPRVRLDDFRDLVRRRMPARLEI